MMAENAANFTFTTQNKPSIFEIIAQKTLNDTLHPALQKVALFLNNINPKNFNWLAKYYEESFLVFSGLLQYHYLKHYGASFSENFYGLQRQLINGKPLKNEDRWLSWAFLVFVPYLKRKVEEHLTVHRIENAEGSLEKDLRGNFKRFLLFLQSALEISWSLWTILNFLKYMSHRSESQLPILKLIDLKLVYSNEPQDTPGFWSVLFKGQLGLPTLSVGLIRNAVSSTLETIAFFLQFLQAWNAQMPNYKLSNLPKVEPPPYDNKAERYRNRCPICLQKWKIPSVLPGSGYVFCFKCILTYLRDTDQKCPVTNIPAQSKDIIILYDNK